MKRKQTLKEKTKSKIGIYLMKLGIRLTINGINISTIRTKTKTVKIKDWVETYKLKNLKKEELLKLPETDRHETIKKFKEVKDIVINKSSPEDEKFIFIVKNGIYDIQNNLRKNREYYWGKQELAKNVKIKKANDIFFEQEKFKKISKRIEEVKLSDNLISKNIIYKIGVGEKKNTQKNASFIFKLDKDEIVIKLLINYNDTTKNKTIKIELFYNEKKVANELISTELIKKIKKEINNLEHGLL